MLGNRCDEKSQLEQDWVLTHAKYKVSRKDPCFLTYCTYSTSAVKESKKKTMKTLPKLNTSDTFLFTPLLTPSVVHIYLE